MERNMPAEPGRGPKRASGKKGKKFAEDLGIDHLVSLSAAITGARDEEERQRVVKAKTRHEATEAKKKKKLASSSTQDGRGGNRAKVGDLAHQLFQSEVVDEPLPSQGLEQMKAVLKAKLKETAKKRKEARKQGEASKSTTTKASPRSKATAPSTSPKSANAPKPPKRVGFAYLENNLRTPSRKTVS